MIAGRLSKSNVNIVLTGNVVKQSLGLSLDLDEEIIEQQRGGKNGSGSAARGKR